MRTVVLEIEDSAYEHFIGILKLSPWAKICEVLSEEEVRRDLDVCIKEAIEELRRNRVFRKSSDYTYIMQVINDKKVDGAPYFLTPDAFRVYLKAIGVEPLPGRSTIYDTIQIMKGEYPQWTFNDPKIDEVETLRRNNVARQFLSALARIKRSHSDGFSDNG